MRYAVIAASVVSLGVPAAAQTPESPVTGARPGNEIGTKSSLPAGNAVSNVLPANTKSVIAPNLPAPDVGPDAGPRGYLEAAQRALAAGKTGETQEALERAESRMLDRSVAPSRADEPAMGPMIELNRQARDSLARGDRGQTQQIITQMLARMAG